MGKIVFGRTGVPLTVDIADENRQELAYNLLHHMMENGASVMVDGKELASDVGQLWLIRDSERIKPEPDAEFDAPSDEKRYSTACMSNNGVIVYFAPLASYDKANDMNNFMLTGLVYYDKAEDSVVGYDMDAVTEFVSSLTGMYPMPDK